MPAANPFDYALVRVVPRVEREEFINVGVILFCRTQRFLGAHIALDAQRLAVLAPALDAAAIERRLALISRICQGGSQAGAIGALSISERFHWLVAPRSTIIQTSRVHGGLCEDAAATLARLFAQVVDQAG